MSTMFKMSEAASLALHTMAVLAREPEKVHSTRDVAATLGVSEAHLAKVMQRLTHARLVRSIRGPRGGFELARPGDEVTLRDVYEAIDAPLVLSGCLLGRAKCIGRGCLLGADCVPGYCNAASHLCSTQCGDGVQNGGETDTRISPEVRVSAS